MLALAFRLKSSKKVVPFSLERERTSGRRGASLIRRDRERNRESERERKRETERQTDRERERERKTDRQKQTDRQTETDRQTHKERERQTDRDRQTDRQTEREREREVRDRLLEDHRHPQISHPFSQGLRHGVTTVERLWNKQASQGHILALA